MRPGDEVALQTQRSFGAGLERTDSENAERAARRSLRAQIAKLEREQSSIVLNTFPHLSPADGELAALPAGAGPMLQSLEQLERSRDRLAGRVSELQALAAGRADHERRAREQLERMRLEPGRYKFVRLPVSDLGERGCGVWEVRPRLGIIGMLAGWWQLKLSSGCPLPRGSRSTRGPFQRS
jgi:hypothetical protein